MSYPTFEDSGRQVTEKDLAKIEKSFGLKLPVEYRRFLLAHNGGYPSPAVFHISESDDSIVDYFFSIDDPEDEFLSLDNQIDYYRGDRIPEALIPIATDPGGNLVCLGIEGKWLGRVYFWDHEREEERPTWRNITQLAGSLDEFLRNLFE